MIGMDHIRPVRVMDFRGTYKGGGGPDKTILNSAARHDENVIDILVVYLRQPGDKEFNIDKQAKLLCIKYTDIIDKYLVDFRCIFKIKKLIIENKISLLHTHDDKTLLYGVILKKLVSNLIIMHTCHSHSDYKKNTFSNMKDYIKYKVRKKIQLLLIKEHISPILTISENTKSRLVKNGIKRDSVEVMYNGVDTKKWNRKNIIGVLKKELNLSNDEIIIGTVARITYDKDFPTFFRVAERIIKKNKKIKFVVVGGGAENELKQVYRCLKTYGISDNIYFTGHRTDLIEIYSSFHIFLMTSITEGFPNTILEAMAMRVPVVSTRVGGVPEIIDDEKYGLLCPIGDDKELANAILQLVDNIQLRDKIASQGRLRVDESFSFQKRVKKLEKCYLKIYNTAKGKCH